MVGKDGTRDECVRLHRTLLAGYLCLSNGNVDAQQAHLRYVVDHLDELRGKDLACWCHGIPCHADTLLMAANPDETERALPRSVTPAMLLTLADVAARLRVPTDERALKRVLRQAQDRLYPGRPRMAPDQRTIHRAQGGPHMLTIRRRKPGGPFYVRGSVRVGKEVREVKEHTSGCRERGAAEAYAHKLEADLRDEILYGAVGRARRVTCAEAMLEYMNRPGGLHRMDVWRLGELGPFLGRCAGCGCAGWLVAVQGGTLCSTCAGDGGSLPRDPAGGDQPRGPRGRLARPGDPAHQVSEPARPLPDEGAAGGAPGSLRAARPADRPDAVLPGLPDARGPSTEVG